MTNPAEALAYELSQARRQPPGAAGATATRSDDVVKLQGGTGNVCTVPVPNTTTPTREIVMPSKRTMRAIDPLRYPTRLAQSAILAHCIMPGEPMSKQRPRFVRKTGAVFTPQETRDREQAVGVLARAQMSEMLADPIAAFGVRAVFYVASFQRKDVDNMMKLLFDGLNGVVWQDDSQVVEMQAWKQKDSEGPRTEFVVYRLPFPANDGQQASCVLCQKPFVIYPSTKSRKYCSRRCMALGFRSGMHVKCSQCGNEVYRSKERLGSYRGPRFFCSKACLSAATAEHLICSHCGIAYSKPQSTRNPGMPYCSLKCAGEGRLSRVKGKPAGQCENCGAGVSKKSYKRCIRCSLRARGEASMAVTEQHLDERGPGILLIIEALPAPGTEGE